jgi:hypothetical protein
VKALRAPKDLLDFLAWHDGSRGREIDLYYCVLSCSEIVRHKKMLDGMVAEFEEAWLPGEWWNLEWIPFLEFNGNLICLDGKGRVLSFATHDAKRPILYASFRRWLTTLVELWEKQRIRQSFDRGYPIRRSARKRPAEKAPKNLKGICENFLRGPYEWRVEQAAATVRTYFGRGISRRYHVKTFGSVDKARAHLDAQVRKKLAEGYARQTSGPCRDTDFLAAAARHLATLT